MSYTIACQDKLFWIISPNCSFNSLDMVIHSLGEIGASKGRFILQPYVNLLTKDRRQKGWQRSGQIARNRSSSVLSFLSGQIGHICWHLWRQMPFCSVHSVGQSELKKFQLFSVDRSMWVVFFLKMMRAFLKILVKFGNDVFVKLGAFT